MPPTRRTPLPLQYLPNIDVRLSSLEFLTAEEVKDALATTQTHVIVDALPASGGGLTDTELRATAVPVSLAAVPSHAVTGPLTDTQMRATPVSISGTVTASGPVTDTQLRATPVPVSGTVTASGPLTDTQLRASAVPVSGTVTAALSGSIGNTAFGVTGDVAVVNSATVGNTTLAVSGTVTASGPLTDTQLRATAVPVSGTVTASGPLTDAQLRANPVPVSGTVTASGPLTDTQLRASAVPISAASLPPVSLGNSTGKTNVLKTGTLGTTAATADQVILTYTVTTGKTLYLSYVDMCARLTTFATTATYFGTASVENPSGTKLATEMCAGAGIAAPPPGLWFAEPLAIASGTVVRVVCTPSATTGFTWTANLGGYEK